MSGLEVRAGRRYSGGDVSVAWRGSGRLADCDDISHKMCVPGRLRPQAACDAGDRLYLGKLQ